MVYIAFVTNEVVAGYWLRHANQIDCRESLALGMHHSWTKLNIEIQYTQLQLMQRSQLWSDTCSACCAARITIAFVYRFNKCSKHISTNPSKSSGMLTAAYHFLPLHSCKFIRLHDYSIQRWSLVQSIHLCAKCKYRMVPHTIIESIYKLNECGIQLHSKWVQEHTDFRLAPATNHELTLVSVGCTWIEFPTSFRNSCYNTLSIFVQFATCASRIFSHRIIPF